jgi:hypothetical protein
LSLRDSTVRPSRAPPAGLGSSDMGACASALGSTPRLASRLEEAESALDFVHLTLGEEVPEASSTASPYGPWTREVAELFSDVGSVLTRLRALRLKASQSR